MTSYTFADDREGENDDIAFIYSIRRKMNQERKKKKKQWWGGGGRGLFDKLLHNRALLITTFVALALVATLYDDSGGSASIMTGKPFGIWYDISSGM
jgi:hypothetical protein